MKHILYTALFALYTTIPLHAVNGIHVVSNTNDSGAGSLRQAIIDANSDPLLPHQINFAIGSGVQTIQPTSALPAITAPFTIVDGTTQPGWSVGNPVIVLDGSLLTPFTIDGITISGTHNCVIRGLVINNGFNNGILITDNGIGAHNNTVIGCFLGTDQTGSSAAANNNGITISGSTNFINHNHIIGTATAGGRNLISGNNSNGILLTTNVDFTLIQNNLIGTDITGTASIPNTVSGINIIGSVPPLANEDCESPLITGNVISGNTGSNTPGIWLQANTYNATILSNIIGADITGTVALPNDIGILCQGQVPPDPLNPFNGAVAGATIGTDNVICCNNSHGILFSTNSINTSVGGNFIGTNSTGIANLGNGGSGILIQGTLNAPCTNLEIGGFAGENIIAFNGTGTVANYGVLLAGDPTTPDTFNSINANSIFNNQSDGIALQNNSNNNQGVPTINNALLNADGNSITIQATAPSIPSSTTYRLDFFANNTDRSPITEGEIAIGFITDVPAGTTVVEIFPIVPALANNIWVSATATNLNAPGSQTGDSSPYSANFPITTLSVNLPALMFEGI